MATKSVPPSPTDEKPQNPAPEVVQTTTEDRKDAKAETTKENSVTSVFVNSEPIREEQVQNAMKFLSHPKVRGSPVIYRRSFLERKGLTKEEIDEAFRRVPDPPPTVSTSQPTDPNEDGQLKSSSHTQTQAPTQILQPAAGAPGPISKVGTFTQSRFHWSHALIAVGILVVSGAGTAVVFKNAIVPRLKSWIRKVVLQEEEALVEKTNSKPSLAEEATAAAKSAASAAADVARASQEMLISKTEEKKHFEQLMNLLNVQVQEMKSMSSAIRKLEGQSNDPVREDHKVATISRQSYANGNTDLETHSARSLSQPTSVEPSVAPHPKSYMEIMAMIQRGEKPPNIREINDLPPNPNQMVSNPRVVPKPKPWEMGQAQNTSIHIQSQESMDVMYSKFQDNGFVNQLNGDDSIPWWQRKNARITEIETEDDLKSVKPVQRSWVPPQPPPVVMPEAAAAIRQPKKSSFQKEQLNDDQLLARSSDIITDDLQRITKISESGGALDANGGTSGLETSEIQKEEESYLET